MFEGRKARAAFENCEVKKVTRWPTLRTFGMFVCAKYPEGINRYHENVGSDAGARQEFAMNLGCLACPYSDLKLVDLIDAQTNGRGVEVMRDSVQQVVELAAINPDPQVTRQLAP